MKSAKTAFQRVLVMPSVKAAKVHAGQPLEMLYHRSIDLGGHANERSITGSMKMVDKSERRVMPAIMLQGDDCH